MSPRPFRLGRSRTGLGLFATKPIKKAARISEYRGRRLDLEAATKAENSGNRYLYEVNSKITIDGAHRSNIARYFNHSCNPNCDTFIRNKRVFIRTLRNIKPDEELTFDYGRDYLKNVIGLENCQCPRCRKRRAKVAAEKREANKRKKLRLARQLALQSDAVTTTATETKTTTKAAGKTTSAKKSKAKTKPKSKAKAKTKPKLKTRKASTSKTKKRKASGKTARSTQRARAA
ncbi:MAG: SET domain-containing protein-lysine N-methyltransferase [Rhodopseudomonas sp.]|nr:SET domain-containing protein-lysine N-methyltransferase [Rhodopseudomonas sp.]